MSDTSKNNCEERHTLTVEEAARMLGIGRDAAYEAVRLGVIPNLKIGRRVLVPKAALLRMLENVSCGQVVAKSAA